MNRGFFISVEGIDGAGKTTLCDQLESYAGRFGSVVRVREPGGTRVSEAIRSFLLALENRDILPRAEAFLYAAARVQLVDAIIRPALEAGHIVIADRYIDSTLAYQGYGRGLKLDLLKQLNRLSVDWVVPDITFLLDFSAIKAQQRRNGTEPDRLEAEGIMFLSRIRQGFLAVAAEEERRIRILNAELNQEELFREAAEHLRPFGFTPEV